MIIQETLTSHRYNILGEGDTSLLEDRAQNPLRKTGQKMGHSQMS